MAFDYQVSARQLAARLADGDLRAVDCVDAYIRRLETFEPELNALTFKRFAEARREAEQADAARRSGRSTGKLHGLPITVKDMLDLEGAPSTAGLPKRAAHRAEQDAVVVARLRRQGAIVLAKTNTACLGPMLETDNRLFGRTNNPWALDRSPGGSSGGEAAVVAAAASPLGLGSDAGGSIRQPAHSCGICGLKPTGGRLPLDGNFLASAWPEGWLQPGPLARRVDDLELLMEHADDAWRSAEASPLRIDSLRVGLYDEGIERLPLSPAITRALREASEHLRTRGVEVVPYRPPDVEAAWALYMAILYADGLRDLREAGRGDQVDWRLRRLLMFAGIPGWLRPILARLFRAGGQWASAEVLTAVRKPTLTAHEKKALLEKADDYCRRIQESMQAQKLSAILCPPFVTPALRHGEFYAYYAGVYCALFNLTRMPAGVAPVTRVREDEQLRRGGWDQTSAALRRIDAGSAGLPVGVQICAAPDREDVVLALLRAIEEEAGEAQLPPLAASDD